MLKVFICEDNIVQKEKIEKIIKDVILIENYDMELELSTHDPHEILNTIENNSISGLYFLDVDLHSDLNGITLAEEIRKYDPRGFIVFVTTHAEMSYLTFLYKVEAMDYIIKDNYNNIQQRISECIKNAHDKYKTKACELQKIFSIKVEDKIINIDFNEIIFFETSQTIHKVILYGKNRQVEFYSKMKELEDKLDDRFCRCHNSFIVNKDNVKEMDKKNHIAHMINGEECLISTRGIKKLIG
ncbi:LytTR family DNA-binding domain-containing protein (plasmid) [Clostridium estertheticum]|uniref:LytR/AlgR family response regulator transcription factor n=1 Tax=Clostridium estertheticum TaxID=238834 RepID=UPI001C7D180A|nr:LytTR family DNA-binding domain-containing protein [Clostridium estertheticum]MBX4262710.1 LytTR family DNA-binding domain-containing protein [Clostridium estertheticum]WLC73121.1 LytTR family DNA-binding domain-containing protein [Clostridium estertheticum]